MILKFSWTKTNGCEETFILIVQNQKQILEVVEALFVVKFVALWIY